MANTPTDNPALYKTPFERAQDAFELAEHHERQIDPNELRHCDAALLRYSVAQSELLAAQLEVLERIERAVARPTDTDDQASALLQQLAEHYQQRGN